MRGWRDRRTRVIDLRGATVIPGLVDAHAHLDREGLKLIHPSLARCRSIADVQMLVRRLAVRAQARRVDRDDAARRAAVLSRRAGVPRRGPLADAGRPRRRRARQSRLPARHLGLLEQAARLLRRQLGRAAARRRDARHGAAARAWRSSEDAAGEPTGVFVERNLIQVLEFTLMRDAPRFTHAERLRALVESQRRYAARGVTSVYEGHGIAPEVLRRLPRGARARATLRLRATLAVSPTWDGPVEAATALREVAAWAGGRGLGDDRLRVAGICLHYGGDAEVARLLHEAQPYTGWAGFVESANAHEAYVLQADAGRAARAARQHAGDAVPARGARRLGGGRHAASHSRPALGAGASERRRRPRSWRGSSGWARSPRPIRSRISGARPPTRSRGSAAPSTRCCRTRACSATAFPSASPPTTSRPIRGWRSWPSSPAAT